MNTWGVFWQITPRELTEALVAGGNEANFLCDDGHEENRGRRDRGGAARYSLRLT